MLSSSGPTLSRATTAASTARAGQTTALNGPARLLRALTALTRARSATPLHAAPVLLPAAALLALVAAGGLVVPVGTLTRDVAAIARVPLFTGVLSSLGILLWCATAAVCLFAARAADPGRIVARRFLASAGAITLYLLLDDQFQIHEVVAPRLFGIGETVVFAVLGAAVAVHLLRFLRLIALTQWRWLALALVLLAVSVVADLVTGRWLASEWAFFIEDGFKWLGIVCWCRYHVGTALAALREPLPA
jgi:hypothetical protein